jgi:hypothetical protein
MICYARHIVISDSSYINAYACIFVFNSKSFSEMLGPSLWLFNSVLYYLCVESTATGPITDTAQCRYW